MSEKSPTNGNRKEQLAKQFLLDNKHPLSIAVAALSGVKSIGKVFVVGSSQQKADIIAFGQRKGKKNRGRNEHTVLTLKTSQDEVGTSCHCGRLENVDAVVKLAGKMTGSEFVCLNKAIGLASTEPWSTVSGNPEALALIEAGTHLIPARKIAKRVLLGPEDSDAAQPSILVVAQGTTAWVGPVESLLRQIPKRGATLFPATKTYASFRLGDFFSLKRDGGNGGTSPDNIQVMLLTYEVFKAAENGDLKDWVCVPFK